MKNSNQFPSRKSQKPPIRKMVDEPTSGSQDIRLTMATLVVLAVGSTFFAGFMITTRSGGVLEEARRVPAATMAWHKGTGTLRQLDMTPTGVLPVGASPGEAGREQEGGGFINYTLRSAGPDRAIIESATGRLLEVAPGDMVPTAGRVVSIDRGPNGWIVVTSTRRIE
jgi:hypothetical protein